MINGSFEKLHFFLQKMQFSCKLFIPRFLFWLDMQTIFLKNLISSCAIGVQIYVNLQYKQLRKIYHLPEPSTARGMHVQGCFDPAGVTISGTVQRQLHLHSSGLKIIAGHPVCVPASEDPGLLALGALLPSAKLFLRSVFCLQAPWHMRHCSGSHEPSARSAQQCRVVLQSAILQCKHHLQRGVIWQVLVGLWNGKHNNTSLGCLATSWCCLLVSVTICIHLGCCCWFRQVWH